MSNLQGRLSTVINRSGFRYFLLTVEGIKLKLSTNIVLTHLRKNVGH